MSGVSYLHAKEAAPDAAVLKLGLTYPQPMRAIRRFAESVRRCVILEEGDPFQFAAARAAGLSVEGKAEMYRFGELNVERVRRILAGDLSPEAAPAPGKPPELCVSCPHRNVFTVLGRLDAFVTGDIGCYTLGVMPPFNAMDTCVCMGASIGVALGLRHVLPEEQARRVVSVIGDSTFMHSGLTGLAEMIYNPPDTGHTLIILDNGTTAMTGLQDHPGTGYTLDNRPTGRISFEAVARAMGVDAVHVLDRAGVERDLEALLRAAMAGSGLTVIITRSPCLLAAKKIHAREKSAGPAGGVEAND